MPGGKANITHADGNEFSSTNQPKNRRKSKKPFTDLLLKESNKKKEITIEGVDVNTGLPTKIKINMPTRLVIAQALLRQAAKGNIIAIKEYADRVEGKSMQGLEIKNAEGESFNITLNLNPK